MVGTENVALGLGTVAVAGLGFANQMFMIFMTSLFGMNSGGGILTAGFMATTVPQTLYVFDSNKGSECYSIGDSSERNSRNFLNAWGNVGWHDFMGKWEVNDINNALKFIPITEVFNDEEIATMDKLTGISNVNVEQKQANTYVYTIDGRMVGKDIKGLAKGLYIVNGKKVVVK